MRGGGAGLALFSLTQAPPPRGEEGRGPGWQEGAGLTPRGQGSRERGLIQTTASHPKPVAHQQTTREPVPGGEGRAGAGTRDPAGPAVPCQVTLGPEAGPGLRPRHSEWNRCPSRHGAWTLHHHGGEEVREELGVATQPRGPAASPYGESRPAPPQRALAQVTSLCPQAWGQGHRCLETTPHTRPPPRPSPRPPPRAACLWGQQVSGSRNPGHVPGKWDPTPCLCDPVPSTQHPKAWL